MFIIVETTKYKKTQDVNTSFGKNLYYDSYDDVEKDLGHIVAIHLPEGNFGTIIRQGDTITLDLPDQVYTVSIEVLNKKGEDEQ